MPESPISRRQLLKVLAAAAGTAVLSSVPNKWRTPVVDVGMLPAHAQTLSGRGAISGTVVTLIETNGARMPGDKPPPSFCTYAIVTVLPSGPSACVDLTSHQYTISNVTPGTYNVSASNGCNTETISPIVVTAGNTTMVSFTLLPCVPVSPDTH